MDTENAQTMSAVDKLRDAVNEFHRLIRELPEEALTDSVWGPRGVLAHEVFWIESYVAQLEAILAGDTPEPPRGGYNELNAQAIEANRSVPVDDLLRRLQVATDRLCGFAQTSEPESIRLAYVKGTPQHTLTWLISAEADHVRHHLLDLEQ